MLSKTYKNTYIKKISIESKQILVECPMTNIILCTKESCNSDNEITLKYTDGIENIFRYEGIDIKYEQNDVTLF